MANWRGAGHAVRRRMGAKSSHLDSLGIGARVNIPTPEEALAGMARVGSPRVPMGLSAITDFANANAVPPLKGDLVPKKGAQAADPTPPTAIRSNVEWESVGAQHRVTVSTPPLTDPAAGATQANGRVIAPSLDRGDSWSDGMTGAYAGY